MMPPSNRDIMNSVGSKYAVVVGISKYARDLKDKELALRAKYKDSSSDAAAIIIPEAEEPLAELVNENCEDLVDKKIVIYHAAPKAVVEKTEEAEEAEDAETADAAEENAETEATEETAAEEADAEE